MTIYTVYSVRVFRHSVLEIVSVNYSAHTQLCPKGSGCLHVDVNISSLSIYFEDYQRQNHHCILSVTGQVVFTFFLKNRFGYLHGTTKKHCNNPVSEGGFHSDTRTPRCERQRFIRNVGVTSDYVFCSYTGIQQTQSFENQLLHYSYFTLKFGYLLAGSRIYHAL
jgi:hypothetical protein